MLRACCRFLGGQLRFKRLLLLALCGWVVGLYLYAAQLADGQLQEAIAEADAVDPGWKLEDWRWGRLPTHDDDPGLSALRAASAKLPVDWPSPVMLDDLRNRAPGERLPEAVLARLGEEVERAAGALAEARKFADRPPAVLRIPWEVPWKLDLEPTPKIGGVTYLLYHDGLYRANSGDTAGALTSCRSALHACQAIDGTSQALGFLARASGSERAMLAIEATLACNQLADADLAALEKLLETERRTPALTNSLRCERASLHWGFSAMESGEIPMSRGYPSIYENSQATRPWVADAYDRLGIPMIRHVHAWMLRYYAEMVEISRLPFPEQNPRLFQLRTSLTARWYTVPPAADMMTFSPQLFNSSQRSQARLRTMLVALAVERQRLRTGVWPESLAAIAPQPWPEAWNDPYDGEPLRYLRLTDGVAIYSVGPDLQDNRGKFDRNLNAPGTDLGVSLWDVDRRGASK